MAAPRRAPPHLSTLNWAMVPTHLSNINYTSSPVIMESDEYTGEDGISEAQYEQDVMSGNAKRRAENKEKIEENKAKGTLGMKPFKVDGLIPTLLAFLGTAQCAPIVVDGRVRILDTLLALRQRAENREIRFDNSMVVTGDAVKGILAFLVAPVRGNVTTGKNKCEGLGHPVSMCRPLLMSAWKLYHGIDYSSYDYNDPELRFINDPGTLGYLRAIADKPGFTKDELIQLRNEVISQCAAGTAQGVYLDIKGSSNTEFNELPKQLKLLLLQLWVYQPHLYQSYAIMNLDNPDLPPEPLVDIEIFVKPEKVIKPKQLVKQTEDLPW